LIKHGILTRILTEITDEQGKDLSLDISLNFAFPVPIRVKKLFNLWLNNAMNPYPWTQEFDPIAVPEAVVTVGLARFTVLTSRLIRLELDPSRTFEDRPSQAFWKRRLDVPEFTVEKSPTKFILQTEHLQLEFDPRATAFTPLTLNITQLKSSVVWRPDMEDWGNLGGTNRTLDDATGRIRLEQGLVSRSGFALVEDSKKLVFDESGWIRPRANPETDWYFFGYGNDYLAALQDFTRLAGPMPHLPRWALGNWWSRYWAYTQAELTGLVQEFQEHGVPLSVCIIDMDWHLTQTGNSSNGWTGYTWNEELFPDRVGFLAWLHAQGLKTSLNLHPALGIHPHEAAYPAMAERMGIDPASQQPVGFDIASQQFSAAYFDLLHHPYEQEGVDFWWIDWQQGGQTRMPGLDPLFWLNHLHWYDLPRDGNKRPFIFSRWGGLGNHRNAIGFSGDSHCTWDSLAFQPYFTATASNVGYGWWSHDIGGHQRGTNDPELYLRWVQYGLFSPILRLHSTCNPWLERRPWGFDAETERHASTAMRLRHQFIPYLYTASWVGHQTSRPLILPMYYLQPEEPAAYECPQAYSFGSELIAAPFTSPRDPQTGLSRQSVWLPDGLWYDFWSGEAYKGGWHVVHGGLGDIPLFAKAGALVPLAEDARWNQPGNPERLHLHAFAGADGHYDLYEDDGETQAYLQGVYAITPLRLRQSGQEMQLNIGPTTGDPGQLPDQRTWIIHLHGLAECKSVTLNGAAATFTFDPIAECIEFTIEGSPAKAIELIISGPLGGRDRRAEQVRRLLAAFRCDVDWKREIDGALAGLLNGTDTLERFAGKLSNAQYAALRDVLEKN
jgi:alpha-glucosidase (family GH31 glycosyl hydrolase)